MKNTAGARIISGARSPWKAENQSVKKQKKSTAKMRGSMRQEPGALCDA